MFKTMTAILAISAAMLLSMTIAASDPVNERKLQQAVDLIDSKRDFARAIPLFEEVAKSSDQALAARALLHLARAQEAQGIAAARATYERIVLKFGGQKEVADAARKRLQELGGTPSSFGGFQNAQVCADCDDPYASIGSDGRTLATIDWEAGDGDLALRDIPTGRLTRLMAKPGNDSDEFGDWAVLSPDMRRVAFLWFTSTGFELRVMPNTPGAKPTVLLKTSAEFTYAEPGGWVDNNSFLVAIAKSDKTWQIARVSVNGAVQPLISLQWRLSGVRGKPAVSPDGRYVAYAALAVNPAKAPAPRGGQPDLKDQYIYVLPVDGSGAERIVARSAGINDSPVWSEDGSRIVFLSDRRLGNRAGVFGMWSVEVRNGEAVAVPEPAQVPVSGRILPVGMTRSGSYYYLQDQTAVDSDVFIADVPGARGASRAPRRLTENSAGANTAPAWSPDGKFIAFKRLRPPSSNATAQNAARNSVFDLVVYSLETREEVVYPIGDNATAAVPIWYHDSKHLLNGVMRLNLPTKEYKSIVALAHATLPDGITARALAPDDKTLYLATLDRKNRTGAIVAFSLITGDHRSVWSKTASAGPGAAAADTAALSRITIGDLVISPDGRALAMTLPSQKGDGLALLRLNVDGTGYREVLSSAAGRIVAWTKAGILYRPAGSDKLMRIAEDGAKPGSTSLVFHPVLSLSPDGAQMVFSDVSLENQGLWAFHNLSSLWKAAR